MTQPGNSPITQRTSGIFSKDMVKVGWQVGCATLLIVFLAYFAGVFLDRYLGTKHILMIVFVICAGPLAMYASYRLALRTIKNISPPGQTIRPDHVGEEEKLGG